MKTISALGKIYQDRHRKPLEAILAAVERDLPSPRAFGGLRYSSMVDDRDVILVGIRDDQEVDFAIHNLVLPWAIPCVKDWKPIWVRMCYLLENALVRMLASSEPPRKPLEANLVAVLCELGAQNEDTHPPCGLPCKSRVTEVSGYQKTLSISARVARTTMPLSDTASSVPTSL